MPATILFGAPVAARILKELSEDVRQFDPKLVVVQIGDDPASASYIRQKLKSCEAVGMRHEHRHLPGATTHESLIECIEELNADDDVSGFIVQLPLPKHLQPHVQDVINAIDPRKDVDGFGPRNLGDVFLSTAGEHLPPATPAGVIALLQYYNIEIGGKNAVVIGRSNIVGKPLAVMLLNRGATVTVCHSRTKNIGEMCRQADILCCAVGSPGMISKEMVKADAVVIDIGITRTQTGTLKGDVDFDSVRHVVSSITPVPGGVGPLTVACLMRNCVRAAKQRAMRT